MYTSVARTVMIWVLNGWILNIIVIEISVTFGYYLAIHFDIINTLVVLMILSIILYEL